jgi:3-hydroxypropionyl-coenzyme A dehydratase
MITAEEAEKIGLFNRVVRLSTEEDIIAILSSTSSQEEQQQQQEILNKKLMDECLSLANQIANNSFTAVKTSKMLINKGMDADINTGLQLEVYGWALCFAHEDRQKMMSSFLKAKEK